MGRPTREASARVCVLISNYIAFKNRIQMFLIKVLNMFEVLLAS